MAGIFKRYPAPVSSREPIMMPAPTEYSGERVTSPFSMIEALAVVPPMSKEMIFDRPIFRASAWAPTTPAAGPDSMILQGRSAAASAVINPPFDCMMCSGAVTPMRLRSARRREQYCRTIGST